MTCPTCHRPAVHAAPCSECWRTMAPADKAGWLFLLRTSTSPAHAGLVSAVGHRDPVRDAPPTLTAYVLFLEAEIARLETRVAELEGRC